MSTTTHSFQRELDQCNDRLDCYLRARFNVSVRLYKSIKAVTQLLAVAAGMFAIAEGADPTLTFAVIGTIVAGPEVAEAFIANTTEGGS